MTEVEMRILLLWDHERLDTWDIAKQVRRHESDVCKTLWRLREDRRRENNSKRSS
jgi:hypothetical protein